MEIQISVAEKWYRLVEQNYTMFRYDSVSKLWKNNGNAIKDSKKMWQEKSKSRL